MGNKGNIIIYRSENTHLCYNVVEIQLSNKLSNRPFMELLPVFTYLLPSYIVYKYSMIATRILRIIMA